MRVFTWGWVLALCCVTCAAGQVKETPPPPIPFPMGAKIVFLGDSITDAGAGPQGYVTLVRKGLTERKKELNLEVIGAGVSGNKVPDLQYRLNKDVLSKKPYLVVIYIGINNVWWWDIRKDAGGTPKDKYEAGLKDLIARIIKAGAYPLLCTPSVIGEKTGAPTKWTRCWMSTPKFPARWPGRPRCAWWTCARASRTT